MWWAYAQKEAGRRERVRIIRLDLIHRTMETEILPVFQEPPSSSAHYESYKSRRDQKLAERPSRAGGRK